MFSVSHYVISWTKTKISKAYSQKGAEMVEYAIVLACIAAIAVVYYQANKTSSGATGTSTLNGILTDLWNLVFNVVDKILK